MDARSTQNVETREVPHGESRYTRHKCRCDICRSAASAAKADRRARNGRETLSDEAKARLLAKQRERRNTDEGRKYEREAKRRYRAKVKAASRVPVGARNQTAGEPCDG